MKTASWPGERSLKISFFLTLSHLYFKNTWFLWFRCLCKFYWWTAVTQKSSGSFWLLLYTIIDKINTLKLRTNLRNFKKQMHWKKELIQQSCDLCMSIGLMACRSIRLLLSVVVSEVYFSFLNLHSTATATNKYSDHVYNTLCFAFAIKVIF